VVVLAGSFLRPVGGWLSDKLGGYRLLLGLFALVTVCLVVVSSLRPIAVLVPMLFLVMGMLGMGNDAVFQMAPQRFSADIELIAGIVGAAGGLGGFFSALGSWRAQGLLWRYGTGVLFFVGLICISFFLLLEFGVHWQSNWSSQALERTRIFAYRRSLEGRPSKGALVGEAEAIGD